MLSHEGIKDVKLLTKEPKGRAMNLWGAVDVAGQYGVVVQTTVDEGRDGMQDFEARPARLYSAQAGTLVFSPDKELPIEPDGKDVTAYRLNGHEVGLRARFSYLQKLVRVEYTMEPCEGSADAFRIGRVETPITETTPGLNGNLPDFQKQMAALAAGTYLDLVVGGMRIAAAFGGNSVQGLQPIENDYLLPERPADEPGQVDLPAPESVLVTT